VRAHDLHDPHDAGLLAVGVVEECQVAGLHGAEVVPRDVVADPIPGLGGGLRGEVVDAEADVVAALEAGLRLGFQEPVVLLAGLAVAGGAGRGLGGDGDAGCFEGFGLGGFGADGRFSGLMSIGDVGDTNHRLRKVSRAICHSND
jgi:hypothetical protein